MASWSQQRRLFYGSVVVLALVMVIGLPVFLYFYNPPSCFDNILNGDEYRVDCGGSCERLCASDFQSPSVAWSRFEEVAPGLYNVAAYIINPNVSGQARNVPYHFSVYDTQGVLINDFDGKVTIPSHRNTLAFRGALSVGKRIPAKASFEFTGYPDWISKNDNLSSLVVINKEFNEENNSSSLTVTLGNNDIHPIGPITVYAVLYDIDGNALGFSKTIVDEIPGKGSSIAPFTWPVKRDGKVVSIEVLPVSE